MMRELYIQGNQDTEFDYLTFNSSKKDGFQEVPKNSDNNDANIRNKPHPICWKYLANKNKNDICGIESSILLSVTFREKKESMPEHTNVNICRDYTNRSLGSCSDSSDGNGGCCSKRIRWYRHTYTSQDLVGYKYEENQQVIDGIEGTFHNVIHLFLRMKKSPFNDDSYYDEGIDKDVPNIILTFAIPTNHKSKFLLWKVKFPSSTTSSQWTHDMAIETLTIFASSVGDSSSSSPSQSYDSIFINGWQSWSFTGNVKKGQMQPKPAMPNVFSGAFNRGGTVPPSGVVHQDDDEEYAILGDEDGEELLSLTENDNTRNTLSTTSHDTNNNVMNNKEVSSPFYTSDFFTVFTSSEAKQQHRQQALILGWLSQQNQFGIITSGQYFRSIYMHCSCDSVILSEIPGEFQTDWAYAQIITHTDDDDDDDDDCKERKIHEPMADYIENVAQYLKVSKRIPPTSKSNPLAVGWCSWYHYYENITLQNLKQNVNKLGGENKKSIETNIVMVDDGYMTAWGDWHDLKPKAFLGSSHNNITTMKSLSDSIRQNNMRPGIWLAPYAIDKHSSIVKKHPDWIIQNEEGRYANSSNCGKWFFALDATNPEVLQFVFQTIQRAVKEWGFSVLKLDFLYAAVLKGNGKYNPNITRAQTMDRALQTIRDAAGPNTYFIGCGCPIASGIGIMNSMRVSADTGPTWYPALPLPWWDNGTLPSLRGMIRNTLTRASFNFRWWHNDPDCLLLGESTNLTTEEVKSAASIIGMTSGMLLLSDDLVNVAKYRMEIGEKVYPLTGATAVVLDQHAFHCETTIPSVLKVSCSSSIEDIDACQEGGKHSLINCIQVAKNLGNWNIVSFSNWFDKARVVSYPLQELLPTANDTIDNNQNGYHLFSFWSSRYIWISGTSNNTSNKNNRGTLTKNLQAHQTEIFIIKPVISNQPQYIGSTLHFSCGSEVESFECDEGDDSSDTHKTRTLRIHFKNCLRRKGWVYIYIPSSVSSTTTNYAMITTSKEGEKPQKIIPEFVANVPYHSISTALKKQNNQRIDYNSCSTDKKDTTYCGHVLRFHITMQGHIIDSSSPNNCEDGKFTYTFLQKKM